MLYEKKVEAQEKRDVDTFLDMLHDDFVMVSHQHGIERDKETFAEMSRQMMSSASLEIKDQRLIYENDEVLVEHSFMSFPDGSKEAVLAVWTKKDGKFTRIETGATPVS